MPTLQWTSVSTRKCPCLAHLKIGVFPISHGQRAKQSVQGGWDITILDPKHERKPRVGLVLQFHIVSHGLSYPILHILYTCSYFFASAMYTSSSIIYRLYHHLLSGNQTWLAENPPAILQGTWRIIPPIASACSKCLLSNSPGLSITIQFINGL